MRSPFIRYLVLNFEIIELNSAIVGVVDRGTLSRFGSRKKAEETGHRQTCRGKLLPYTGQATSGARLIYCQELKQTGEFVNITWILYHAKMLS